jgi:hypothetical protein
LSSQATAKITTAASNAHRSRLLLYTTTGLD